MIVSSTTEVSESEYIAAGYTIGEGESDMRNTISAIYPLPPTKAIYDAGGTYYHRNYYICLSRRPNGKVYYRIDLPCVRHYFQKRSQRTSYASINESYLILSFSYSQSNSNFGIKRNQYDYTAAT